MDFVLDKCQLSSSVGQNELLQISQGFLVRNQNLLESLTQRFNIKPFQFEVVSVRGGIENNELAHWQVTAKIGFTLDD